MRQGGRGRTCEGFEGEGADDENDLRSLCSMFTHSKNLSRFPLAEGSHSCLPSDRYLGVEFMATCNKNLTLIGWFKNYTVTTLII